MEARKPPAVTTVGNGKVEERSGAPKQNPDKAFFYRMRGRKVLVQMLDGEALEGTISWVDKYTFGFVAHQTGETLYYKHGVKFIRPVR